MSDKKKRVLVVDTPRRICIDDKNEIRVSKTMKEGENVLCVDIRKFRLYPIDGHYDYQCKATPRGITFSLDKLPMLLASLHDIYYDEFGKEFVRSEVE